MPRPSRVTFVDSTSGGLAALAAAVCELHGIEARAATESAGVAVQPESERALAELGLPVPEVSRWEGEPGAGPGASDGSVVVALGAAKTPAAARWPAALWTAPVVPPGEAPVLKGEGLAGLPLERLATARAMRDAFERLVESLLVSA